MKINYLREDALIRLKMNRGNNIDYYKNDKTWLNNFFEAENYVLPTNIITSDIELVESKDSNFDFENAKRIYNELGILNITQAKDERLWAYLTHEVFWNYMRKRWNVEEQENPEKYIKERYFLVSNPARSLVRNGIARLWWYAHVSYESSYSDPYELTKILLEKQDVASQLTERAFVRNKDITKYILSIIANMKKVEKKHFLKRGNFREFMRNLNYVGGVTVIDALSKDDIKEIIYKHLKSA